MQIGRLDHVNVRTENLAPMIEWYESVLGMTNGRRPDFSFGGAWLYAGDHPIVHLVEVAAGPKNQEPRIEHFAISATGLPGFIQRLNARGIPYTLDPVPGFPIVQINLHDPDGNHLHIDFADAEAKGLL